MESSNLMIKNFLKLISQQLDSTEAKARNLYYGLKEAGYIDSSQIGRNKSKVWLTDMGNKKVEHYKTLRTLRTLEPEKPKDEKSGWFNIKNPFKKS
jgi:hypothetical protein